MIEDYITDTLEEYGPLYVLDLVLGAREDLACRAEDVEDAIINLESQGKVRGYIEETTGVARIELVNV